MNLIDMKESASMESILTESKFHELCAEGRGFIFNDFSLGASGKQNNILHRADCGWLAKANLGVKKIYFESMDEAVSWLDRNRPSNWKFCGSCCRSGLGSSVLPARPPAISGGPEPFKEQMVQARLVEHLREIGSQIREGVPVPSGRIDVVAEHLADEWVIEVKGEDRGGYTSAQMNFQLGVGQLLSRMTDRGYRYALAFPLTPNFRRVLRTYEGTFGFEQVGISAFIVTPDRGVHLLNPGGFHQFIDSGCRLKAVEGATRVGNELPGGPIGV